MMHTKLKAMRDELKGKEKAPGEQVVISERERSQKSKEPAHKDPRTDPEDPNAKIFYGPFFSREPTEI